MLRGSRQLIKNLLRGSWRLSDHLDIWRVVNFLVTSRQLVTRKLTTSRGSYEELVPVELGLHGVAKAESQSFSSSGTLESSQFMSA